MKAFPRTNGAFSDELGMDLRDYFASKAMVAILAEEMRVYKLLEFTDNGEDLPSSDLKALAHRAYYMADAMIYARGM